MKVFQPNYQRLSWKKTEQNYLLKYQLKNVIVSFNIEKIKLNFFQKKKKKKKTENTYRAAWITWTSALKKKKKKKKKKKQAPTVLNWT